MRTGITILACALTVKAGDPDHGRIVVQNQACLECHTVNGIGAGHESLRPATDLASRLATTYTPSALASALWNHTPSMWAALGEKSLAISASEADWQDAFAYLYSLQFFEHPAEVRRGKDLLSGKCGACHADSGIAPPPSRWNRVDDPVTLVYDMWNHAPQMTRKLTDQKKEWIRLSARDFVDLTAYLQYLHTQAPNRRLSLPPASEGREPFALHCATCHTGTRALETRLRNKTWMDIGAGMWNHAPAMLNVPVIPPEDMRKILAYVWELQYRGAPGNPDQGHRTFNNKRCIACHKDAATSEPRSPRPGQTFTTFSMVSLSWGRAREMHRKMIGERIPWPSLSAHEMNNLVAFLNTLK